MTISVCLGKWSFGCNEGTSDRGGFQRDEEEERRLEGASIYNSFKKFFCEGQLEGKMRLEKFCFYLREKNHFFSSKLRKKMKTRRDKGKLQNEVP